ncbi:hypothetical protein [Nostoc sp.]|uniref:hypothetical protein n=1 Tax=Nostoc sp. TaxID=1180 RepID=UPI002FFB7CDB
MKTKTIGHNQHFHFTELILRMGLIDEPLILVLLLFLLWYHSCPILSDCWWSILALLFSSGEVSRQQEFAFETVDELFH